MRVAIATDNNTVSAHFGRCATYTLVDIEENQIVNRKVIENPEHQPGFLPGFLANLGAHCIVCGGMGPRAQNLFTRQNIQTIIGVTGEIDEVIGRLLNGSLEAGESTCDQSSGHGHGHGHGQCDRHH